MIYVEAFVIKSEEEGFLSGLFVKPEVLPDFEVSPLRAALYPEPSHALFIKQILEREGYTKLHLMLITIDVKDVQEGEIVNEPAPISAQTPTAIKAEGVSFAL